MRIECIIDQKLLQKEVRMDTPQMNRFEIDLDRNNNVEELLAALTLYFPSMQINRVAVYYNGQHLNQNQVLGDYRKPELHLQIREKSISCCQVI